MAIALPISTPRTGGAARCGTRAHTLGMEPVPVLQGRPSATYVAEEGEGEATGPSTTRFFQMCFVFFDGEGFDDRIAPSPWRSACAASPMMIPAWKTGRRCSEGREVPKESNVKELMNACEMRDGQKRWR